MHTSVLTLYKCSIYLSMLIQHICMHMQSTDLNEIYDVNQPFGERICFALILVYSTWEPCGPGPYPET